MTLPAITNLSDLTLEDIRLIGLRTLKRIQVLVNLPSTRGWDVTEDDQPYSSIEWSVNGRPTSLRAILSANGVEFHLVSRAPNLTTFVFEDRTEAVWTMYVAQSGPRRGQLRIHSDAWSNPQDSDNRLSSDDEVLAGAPGNRVDSSIESMIRWFVLAHINYGRDARNDLLS